MTAVPPGGSGATPAGGDAARTELITAIHASDTLAVLAVTGGGIAALGWLLSVPGASRTVLEGTVPYATTALAELVGFEPAQAVSATTAEAMASACLRRAVQLAPEAPGPLVGVAATAALVSDRPKKGEHRAYVSVASEASTTTYSIVLAKGRRDRPGEDAVVAELVVAALAVACGVEDVARWGPGEGDVVVPAWPSAR